MLHFNRRFSLPAWLDHFNARDLKTLFRCWVATWVASLLMFIGPSLHRIGFATFFSALVLYMAPPAGILFVYLLTALSLLGGMCLAWAWGLLTMKAAQAARPSSQTQARLQQLQEQAARNAQQSGDSIPWAAQKLVHDGFMLDARVTVIFYVMSCVFVYTMARLRATNPKFQPAEVYGDIVMDLFLLFGPSLPSFNAQLARVLVEPGAIGIGLGTVCCLLFFPQSTSHAVLGKMEQLVGLGEDALRCTRARFAEEPVELAQLEAVNTKTITVLNAMKPMLAFLPLDMSRGRWGAEDVRSLHDPVRQVTVAQMTLVDYHISRVQAEQKLSKIIEQEEKPPHNIGQRQLQQSRDLMLALNEPERGTIRSHTLEALRLSTAEVLQACSDVISLTAGCVRTVNTSRWRRHPPQDQFDQMVSRGQHTLDRLRSARETCISETAHRLLEAHADHFDENGQLKAAEFLGPHALRSLILGMVVEERILAFATAHEQLLAHVIQLLKKRTRNRIWVPFRLRYAMKWLANGRLSTLGLGSSTTDGDPDTLEKQTREAYRQLHISKGYYTPQRQRLLSRAIRGSYLWLTNPAGMYALRMVVVTIATAIPASLPSTASFYYRERGIWGTITAQIAVLVYMADFTISLLGRVGGTIIGGLLGMVAWYIGSGHGLGNGYGLAAITAVMTLILVWLRLFIQPPLTSSGIVCGVTFVLVIGFSYDDAHTTRYGLPGHGYEAFYKRVVTVLLGLFAALIVQIFPRPPSASRHVRKSLSNAIHTLSDHYALLLSHWNRNDPAAAPITIIADQISLSVSESLRSLSQPINLLKFEFSLSPVLSSQHPLQRINTLAMAMNQALSHLLRLSDTLSPAMQTRLANAVGILNDDSITAVMAVLSVIEQVLKTGDPLPE